MKPRAPIFCRMLLQLLGVLLFVVSCGPAAPSTSPGTKTNATGAKTNSPKSPAKSDKSAKPGKTPPVAKEAVTNATRVEAALPLEIPKSVFLIPTNQAAGKYPFFPRSMNPYGTTVVTPTSKTNPVVVVPDLVLGGVSGTPEKPLAIINTYTFGLGEERDVVFSSGKRVKVRCLEINLQTGTVVVEVSGQRRTLQFKQGRPGK